MPALPAGRGSLAEALIAIVAGTVLAHLGSAPIATSLAFPFFKELVIDLGWFFVLLGAFVIVGAGNAVNLTDGLDGLAIVPVIIAAATSADRLSGRQRGLRRLSADPLRRRHRRTGRAVRRDDRRRARLPVVQRAAGRDLHGRYRLALARRRSAPIAVATKHEIVLAIVGGLFVLEAVSVIIQVVSFKLTGKRVFKMAPIHHHFEQLGWTEPQIVIRFWIIAVVLALAGLATLKLR